MTTIKEEILKEALEKFGETRSIARPDGTVDHKKFITRGLEDFLSQSIDKVVEETRKEMPKDTLLGVDTGTKYGDKTCYVYGKRLKNGEVKITKIKYSSPNK